MSRHNIYEKTPGYRADLISMALLLTFLSLIHLKVCGQSPTKEETIRVINETLGPGSILKCVSGELQITRYDDSGKISTLDRVYPEALDLTIFHDEENNMLCIPCMNGRQQCVTRTLSSTQRKRILNSLQIPVKDTRDFYLLMRAFEHLIRLTSENDYKAEVDIN